MVKPLVDMVEAARLLGDGRVGEATALLRRRIGARTGAAGRSERPARPAGWSGRGSTPTGGRHELGQLGDLLRDVLGKARPSGEAPPTSAPKRPAPEDVVPPGGKFLARNYTGEGGARPFKLFVPSGYRGEPVPLIVMLHGCTQSPDDFAAGTRMNQAAEGRTCLVAYPTQTQQANASRCWNWFQASEQHRGTGEPAIVAGITRQVMAEYAVNPQEVFVAGLSAGGALAAIMAATYPELYAAVGVHSGLACGAARDLPSAFAAMREGAGPARRAGGAHRSGATPRAIVFHGDRDETVHPRNGEGVMTQMLADTRLRQQVEGGTAPGGRRYTRTKYSDEDGRLVHELWAIHGAGHAWAGGSPAGSYTDGSGPDATGAMLRFFLREAND